MEKLKTGDRNAIDLGDQLGIDLARRNELSYKLDAFVQDATTGGVRLVYMIDIIEYIHGICETQEEYTWCLVLHIQWLYKNQRMITVYNT